MRLIETDILTLLFFGNPQVCARWQASPLTEGITVITRAEMLSGRLTGLLSEADPAAILQRQERLRQTEEFLARFAVIPLDATALARFEELRRTRACRKIGVPDLLNAAIALALDATLVTRNTKDYTKVPNLKLENWAD
jgi:tRNA(fMet)-specific endonuclease VapC